VLQGEQGPRRDAVVLNAAGALWAAGVVDDLAEGARRAAQAIDSGAALERLDRFVALSREQKGRA
jgi:anthranilate phosphoribosyltransferase